MWIREEGFERWREREWGGGLRGSQGLTRTRLARKTAATAASAVSQGTAPEPAATCACGKRERAGVCGWRERERDR